MEHCPQVCSFRRPLLLLAAFLVLGCAGDPYRYTDPDYKITISYPGTADLFNDKEALREQLAEENPEQSDSIDRPELLFVLTTVGRGQLTCSVHRLPQDSTLTAEQYYEVSTAAELESRRVEIMEPKSELVVDGRTFQMVGFKVEADDRKVHSRIFQHLDPQTKRVLVVTTSALDSDWVTEGPAMKSMVESIRVGWSESKPES